MTYQPGAYGAAHPLRGHGAKIAEAARALRELGRFPPNLRSVERDRRIIDWLTVHGYAEDLPSRHAIARHFRFHLQSEQLAPIAQ
jgi:hypothetical protein